MGLSLTLEGFRGYTGGPSAMGAGADERCEMTLRRVSYAFAQNRSAAVRLRRESAAPGGSLSPRP